MRRLLVTLCATAVLAARPSEAQTAAAVERALLPLKPGVLAGLPDTFWGGLAFVRAEEDRQRSLRADITFGLTGDETDSRSLFRLNTGIALARAAFPSEVTVVNRLALLLRDGEVQEDVTNLQISYDYHAGRHLEYFAFAERFADNFLSIQQRYEVGFGLRAGVTLGHVGPWQETEARFAAVARQLPAVAAAAAAVPAGVPPPVTPADLDRLTTTMGFLRDSFRERQARLFVGLATSVFAEVERAELDLLATPLPGADGAATRVKIPLPGTHRYRVSLRPTLRVRPTRDVLITVLPYYKLPLDGPRRVLRDGERRLDYRRDLLTEMVWAIRQDQAGLENVDLVATLSHFYDNLPPALGPSALADAAASGRGYTRTVADESHRFATISLRLRW
ncbi:MAG: hypothetical protein JNL48_08670 [Acidobacteria bacterium]|nr:hypothetical protein [Acidobacteriota bacterium]